MVDLKTHMLYNVQLLLFFVPNRPGFQVLAKNLFNAFNSSSTDNMYRSIFDIYPCNTSPLYHNNNDLFCFAHLYLCIDNVCICCICLLCAVFLFISRTTSNCTTMRVVVDPLAAQYNHCYCRFCEHRAAAAAATAIGVTVFAKPTHYGHNAA